ncbi:curli assembly protein CsgF [Thermodesulfovibrio hydrogeniphilus]
MRGLLIFFISTIIASSAFGSELVFQFTNPSFGGNPLNGSFLLQQAQLQNKFKEKTPESSLMDQMNQMYQAQYLGTILEDIYKGKLTPTEGDTYNLGGLIIKVTKVESSIITLSITDTSTGNQWTYQIPYGISP